MQEPLRTVPRKKAVIGDTKLWEMIKTKEAQMTSKNTMVLETAEEKGFQRGTPL